MSGTTDVQTKISFFNSILIWAHSHLGSSGLNLTLIWILYDVRPSLGSSYSSNTKVIEQMFFVLTNATVQHYVSTWGQKWVWAVYNLWAQFIRIMWIAIADLMIWFIKNFQELVNTGIATLFYIIAFIVQLATWSNIHPTSFLNFHRSSNIAAGVRWFFASFWVLTRETTTDGAVCNSVIVSLDGNEKMIIWNFNGNLSVWFSVLDYSTRSPMPHPRTSCIWNIKVLQRRRFLILVFFV